MSEILVMDLSFLGGGMEIRAQIDKAVPPLMDEEMGYIVRNFNRS